MEPVWAEHNSKCQNIPIKQAITLHFKSKEEATTEPTKA